SNKDIASDLHISEQAIKALVSRLLLKYGVANRTMLANASAPRPDGKPSNAAPALRAALQASHDLRDRNDDLMANMRAQMRGLKQLRTSMRKDRQKREGDAEATR